MCLHTQKDSVGSQTGQTSFKIRLAPKLLSFCIKVIQSLNRLFKLLPIDLQKRLSLTRLTQQISHSRLTDPQYRDLASVLEQSVNQQCHLQTVSNNMESKGLVQVPNYFHKLQHLVKQQLSDLKSLDQMCIPTLLSFIVCIVIQPRDGILSGVMEFFQATVEPISRHSLTMCFILCVSFAALI